MSDAPRTRKASKKYLVTIPNADGVNIGTEDGDVKVVALTTKSDEAMQAIQDNPGAQFVIMD